jgi:hypothetical protein
MFINKQNCPQPPTHQNMSSFKYMWVYMILFDVKSSAMNVDNPLFTGKKLLLTLIIRVKSNKIV